MPEPNIVDIHALATDIKSKAIGTAAPPFIDAPNTIDVNSPRGRTRFA